MGRACECVHVFVNKQLSVISSAAATRPVGDRKRRVRVCVLPIPPFLLLQQDGAEGEFTYCVSP